MAVAVVGDGAQCEGIGVDVERLGTTREGFEIGAFTSEERGLLSQNGSLREEQAMRLWCAKEAVAKALGRGLMGGPRGLLAQRLDARKGIVELTVSGTMAKEFPELRGINLTAFTLREGDLIFASSLCKRS
jgi:phosphopantetheinyl transferase